MKRPAAKRTLAKSTARSKPGKTPARTRATTGGALLSSTSPKVPPKWTWHYRVLLKVRERLLQDRGEQLREGAEPLEPHSMDLADSATDEFDHDLALSQLSAEQDGLYEVEEAIKRILAGTYGTCEETGQLIPAARLRAIPWTRFSEEVQGRLERKGTVKREHLGAVASVRGPDVKSLEEVPETPGEEQEPETAPEDEALWPVYSPPGKHLHPERPKRRGSGGEGGTA